VDVDDRAGSGVGPGAGSPEPKPLAAADSVPVFRTDLKIDKGANAGLFEVTDPVSGRHFTLYEFELSIARMLDGRRHASDVIENGVRLGIPIDLDGLYKFVRQLWRYGFLAPPGVEPVPAEGEAEGGWPDREKWDEATRTLFQTGLRMLRQGRPQDAQSYFQAVLDGAPDHDEAREYLAAIERGDNLAAAPIGARATGVLQLPAKGHPKRLIAGLAVIAAAAAAAALFLLLRRHEPPRPPPPPPAPPPVAKPAAPANPWRTAAVQQREHPSLGEITAAGDGSVAWRKKSGDRVKEGERLGLLRRTKGAKPVPLVANESGTLALKAVDGARVAAGSLLAAIVDDRVWIVDAFVDGEPPKADALCELRGDAVAERVGCALDSSRPREGGSQLMLTVKAAEAPWLGASKSLRVRIAPAGTPPEPAGAPR
jgi:biotin carboxyl carrier protein